MTGPTTIFGSAAFARALAERPLVALDIGARRGFIADLLPIAAAVVPPIYLIRGASRTPTGPPALVMAPSSL